MKNIPIDSKTIQLLASKNIIDKKAKERAFELLYAKVDWRLLASRILLVIGISLIIISLIKLIKYNLKTTDYVAYWNIAQLTIVVCVSLAFLYQKNKLAESLAIFVATISVGYLFTSLNDVYITSSSFYQYKNVILWMMLITPWVIVMKSGLLWILWMLIFNIFTVFYWNEVLYIGKNLQPLLVSSSLFLLLAFLYIREYFCNKGVNWIQNQWIRIFILIMILVNSLITYLPLTVVEVKNIDYGLILNSAFHMIANILLYIIYRYKNPSLSASVINIMPIIIAVAVLIFKAILYLNLSDIGNFAVMSIVILIMIIFAIISLNKFAIERRSSNDAI